MPFGGSLHRDPHQGGGAAGPIRRAASSFLAQAGPDGSFVTALMGLGEAQAMAGGSHRTADLRHPCGPPFHEGAAGGTWFLNNAILEPEKNPRQAHFGAVFSIWGK